MSASVRITVDVGQTGIDPTTITDAFQQMATSAGAISTQMGALISSLNDVAASLKGLDVGSISAGQSISVLSQASKEAEISGAQLAASISNVNSQLAATPKLAEDAWASLEEVQQIAANLAATGTISPGGAEGIHGGLLSEGYKPGLAQLGLTAGIAPTLTEEKLGPGAWASYVQEGAILEANSEGLIAFAKSLDEEGRALESNTQFVYQNWRAFSGMSDSMVSATEGTKEWTEAILAAQIMQTPKGFEYLTPAPPTPQLISANPMEGLRPEAQDLAAVREQMDANIGSVERLVMARDELRGAIQNSIAVWDKENAQMDANAISVERLNQSRQELLNTITRESEAWNILATAQAEAAQVAFTPQTIPSGDMVNEYEQIKDRSWIQPETFPYTELSGEYAAVKEQSDQLNTSSINLSSTIKELDTTTFEAIGSRNAMEEALAREAAAAQQVAVAIQAQIDAENTLAVSAQRMMTAQNMQYNTPVNILEGSFVEGEWRRPSSAGEQLWQGATNTAPEMQALAGDYASVREQSDMLAQGTAQLTAQYQVFDDEAIRAAASATKLSAAQGTAGVSARSVLLDLRMFAFGLRTIRTELGDTNPLMSAITDKLILFAAVATMVASGLDMYSKSGAIAKMISNAYASSALAAALASETLTAAVGTLAAAYGPILVVLAAVAAALAYINWYEGVNGVNAANDSIKNYTDQVKVLTDQLSELKDQQEAVNEQMDRTNLLSAQLDYAIMLQGFATPQQEAMKQQLRVQSATESIQNMQIQMQERPLQHSIDTLNTSIKELTAKLPDIKAAADAQLATTVAGTANQATGNVSVSPSEVDAFWNMLGIKTNYATYGSGNSNPANTQGTIPTHIESGNLLVNLFSDIGKFFREDLPRQLAALQGVTIPAHQYGVHTEVDQPTLFMAGESGREQVDVTPYGEMSSHEVTPEQASAGMNINAPISVQVSFPNADLSNVRDVKGMAHDTAIIMSREIQENLARQRWGANRV